ncbi:hypothetical protein MUK42_28653 [Musa troglodytarum]|uniref:Uncharacterized protein n=1 Tax=Musa troglodytarum TaxID=320322 RepID=A0A9E7KE74_9LILI|nr:hypothetical protein MUK42_28653 [Musa troglodytarum]
MRFADFFARSFASVSAPQLPWVKMLKESPVAKIAVIPLCHISVSVYKTSVDWIALKSPETLANFVLWCLDDIIANLANQQSVTKGSKKSVQQIPSSNQVEIFVVLAIALRWKPDALLSLLSKLRDNPDIKDKRNSHMLFGLLHSWRRKELMTMECGEGEGDSDGGTFKRQQWWWKKLRTTAAMVAKAMDSDVVGIGPKARSSLLNRAVRKGERLLLHAVFDLLMRMIPAPTALVKATERFRAVYPTLKELALAASPGTKTTKQASHSHSRKYN